MDVRVVRGAWCVVRRIPEAIPRATHHAQRTTMKVLPAILVAFFLSIAFAVPVFAQSNGAFYNDLRQNLGTTSTPEATVVVGRKDAVPSPTPVRQAVPLGKADTMATSSLPATAASDSNAYVAGSDSWSAPIAGVAAVLSVIVIALIVWFIIGHRRSESHES